MPDSILVFDGVCVLCSRWVRFVLRHDRIGRYKFAAMQSATGRRLLLDHGLNPEDPVSFLLLEDGAGYTDSAAFVRVLRSFDGAWRLLGSGLQIVPRFVRDPIYRWIARHRYRLFGRHEDCLVPAPDVADRFLR